MGFKYVLNNKHLHLNLFELCGYSVEIKQIHKVVENLHKTFRQSLKHKDATESLATSIAL